MSMTESELPPEAAEADVLEQQLDVLPEPEEQEPPAVAEPSLEADPADVAEQAMPVAGADDDYGDYDAD